MPTDLSSIIKIKVPVIVLIAEHELSVREVCSLAPGAILELPKSINDDLEILINDQPIGLGQAVKVGENFGVQVTFVGDMKQRIKALGMKKAANTHETDESVETADSQTPQVDPASDPQSSEASADTEAQTPAEQVTAGP